MLNHPRRNDYHVDVACDAASGHAPAGTHDGRCCLRRPVSAHTHGGRAAVEDGRSDMRPGQRREGRAMGPMGATALAWKCRRGYGLATRTERTRRECTRTIAQSSNPPPRQGPQSPSKSLPPIPARTRSRSPRSRSYHHSLALLPRPALAPWPLPATPHPAIPRRLLPAGHLLVASQRRLCPAYPYTRRPSSQHSIRLSASPWLCDFV